MSAFGYHPHFYNYQPCQLHYPSATYSNSSDNANEPTYNQPIATSWLNQGLNATTYSPYHHHHHQHHQNHQNQQPISWINQFYPLKDIGAQYAPQMHPEQPTYTQQSMSQMTANHEEEATQSRVSSVHSQLIQASGDLEEDMTQLTPQIEAAYEEATGKRRQPVVKRQVITMPGEAGRVQQIVRRLPTPTPDLIERVFIVKPQRDMINLVIERPATPPVQYRDRTVYGKSRRPIINPKVVTVQPRNVCAQVEGSAAQYQQTFMPVQDYSQHVEAQQLAQGYLLAPVRYEQQQQQVQIEQQQNPATFSQILQPYTQTQFFEYQPQQYQNYTYQSNYGTQLF